MAATTLPSMPRGFSNVQQQISDFDPKSLKYEKIFIRAKHWDIYAGSPTAGDLGGTNKLEGYTSFTTNDAVCTIIGIPNWLDTTEKIYFEVLFNAETAAKNPTWTITYEAFAMGDDVDVAIDTALDGTVPITTNGAAGDTELLRQTYAGYINGATLDSDAELLEIALTLTANDSATDWVFWGMNIYLPRAAN